MATGRPTKREFSYSEAELDPELIARLEVAQPAPRRTVARLALLWRERRFLFRCAAIGFLSSTLLVFLIPVRYTSTAQLMPPDQVGEGLASTLAALTKGSGSELGAIGGELLGLRTSSDLFVGVLHSRTVQDDLINKFDLRKLYGVRRIEDARKQLTSRTDVSGDRKSGIITIKVVDHNPQRAAAMAREYVNELNQIVVTLNTSAAHKERVFLETRLTQVQQDLEAAEKDFGNFASQNTALDVKEQGKALIGATAELEGQLIAAQTQLEGLRQIYTDENVRVRSLEARIAEYRRQLKKLDGRNGQANGEQQNPESDQSLNQSDDDLYPSIRKLPILGVTWADLYRRTKVQEVVFETLTKQYEIAKVEEARETPSVKVLDSPDVPEEKSFPPRMLLAILSTFLVFAGASVWLFTRERWQQMDSADPRKVLALDVWQTMRASPFVDRAIHAVHRNGRSNGARPATGTGSANSHPNREEDDEQT